MGKGEGEGRGGKGEGETKGREEESLFKSNFNKIISDVIILVLHEKPIFHDYIKLMIDYNDVF